MATREKEYGYFPHSYFGQSYFPAVWFAPAFEALDDEEELQVIHGPGIYREEKREEKREPRSSRDFDFLDPEYHKRLISPKVRKIIKRIAKKAVSTPTEAKTDAQNRSVTNDWNTALIRALETEQIAWNRFYADLLAKQINDQISARIRHQFELMGLYQQLEMEAEDEQALMLLFMEL